MESIGIYNGNYGSSKDNKQLSYPSPHDKHYKHSEHDRHDKHNKHDKLVPCYHLNIQAESCVLAQPRLSQTFCRHKDIRDKNMNNYNTKVYSVFILLLAGTSIDLPVGYMDQPKGLLHIYLWRRLCGRQERRLFR